MSLAAAAAALPVGDVQIPPRLAQAGEDFEAMVMGEMFTPMFESLDTNGPFGGGAGEEAFRSFLIQELGKSVARRGGIGMGKAMIQSLLSMQEVFHG